MRITDSPARKNTNFSLRRGRVIYYREGGEKKNKNSLTFRIDTGGKEKRKEGGFLGKKLI